MPSFRPARIAFALAGVAATAWVFPAWAEDDLSAMALEDLLKVEVVSASRFAQSTTEAPASVTVIGNEELRAHDYRNLGEALSTVPGLYTSNDRGYTSLGVRGFNRPGDYGTRLLLLTDGSRRNDPLYDQVLVGNEAPIEVDWIKQIEFVPGPASAVYGANALFGTINTVMLNGADVNGYRVSLDAGNDFTRRLGLVAGQRLEGDRDWFVGFASYRSDGADYDGGPGRGLATGLDGEKYDKLYAKYRWGNWRAAFNFSQREKDIPTGWYDTTYGAPGTNARDTSYLAELRYDGDVRAGWQPSFRLYHGRYRFDGDYEYSDPTRARDAAVADWTGTEWHVAYTGLAAHKIAFGVDAQWNTRVEQRYYDSGSGTWVLDTNNPSRVVSVFAQDEWRFRDDWLLNLSVRHDKHSDFSGVVSPRAALIWQTTPRLTLKAIAGRAYRVPNAYERFYADGSSQVGNDELRPETITTMELAAVYRLGASTQFGASVYHNLIKDMIDQEPIGGGLVKFVNLDNVKAHGVELSAEHAWSETHRLRGSVAWQESRMEDGTLLVDSPRWLGKVVYSVPFAAGWSASGELLGVASRRGDNGPVPGYGIANISIFNALPAKLGRLQLSIHNLGDRKYHDPTDTYINQESVEQLGRQIRVRWTLPL